MTVRDQDWFLFAVTRSLTHPEALQWLHETAMRLGNSLGEHEQFNICEIGSWQGGSSIVLFDALQPRGGALTCIDNFKSLNGKDGPKRLPDDTLDIFEQTVKQYLAMVGATYEFTWTFDGFTLTRGGQHSSFLVLDMNGSPGAREGMDDSRNIGMLFLDGDHTYDGVTNDLKAFASKMRVGGIVCGHDATGEPQVLPSVRDYFGHEPQLAPGDLWWLEVLK